MVRVVARLRLGLSTSRRRQWLAGRVDDSRHSGVAVPGLFREGENGRPPPWWPVESKSSSWEACPGVVWMRLSGGTFTSAVKVLAAAKVLLRVAGGLAVAESG